MTNRPLQQALGAALALAGWDAAVEASTLYTFNFAGAQSQSFTALHTATYRITAIGAQGGFGNAGAFAGGFGAEIAGDFTLTGGTSLTLYVGGAGGNGGGSGDYRGGGGGGGSFVIAGGNLKLVIAGGGGGAGSNNLISGCTGSPGVGLNASTLTSGVHGDCNLGGAGGSGGGGGSTGNAVYTGGGGGGFVGNGQNGTDSSVINPSLAFGGLAYPVLTGGAGVGSGGTGGFGGGGGGFLGGGGGGGYSGGGTGVAGGGGGGSFNGGANPYAAITSRAGNGLITIEDLTPSASVPELDALSGTGALALVGFGVALAGERRRRG